MEGFALLGLRYNLIAGQACGETSFTGHHTPDERHDILEVEVVLLDDGEVHRLLLATVGVVLDPLAELRTNDRKVLHPKRAAHQVVIPEIFGTDSWVYRVGLPWSIAVDGVSDLLIDKLYQTLGFTGGITLFLGEVAVAPLYGVAVVFAEDVVDETDTLVARLCYIVVELTIHDRGS